MSSSSIDYHEGYLQCLADLKKISEQDENSPLNDFIKSKSVEHTKNVSDILESMYKIYKES